MYALNRRDPFSFLDDVLGELWVRPAVPQTSEQSPAQWRARFDAVERDNAYEVTAELPGVKKEDIQLEVFNKRVSITAEVKNHRQLREGERLLVAERQVGQFVRQFELPQPIDENQVEAKFEDGILTLVLPKKEKVQAKRISVN